MIQTPALETPSGGADSDTRWEVHAEAEGSPGAGERAKAEEVQLVAWSLLGFPRGQ